MYGACAPLAALMEHYCIGWPRLFSLPRQVGQRYVQLRTQWPRLEPPGLLAAKVASRSLSWVRRRSAKCDWLADRRGQGGRTTRKGPGPVTRGKVANLPLMKA